MIDINFCDDIFCEDSIYGLTQWDVGQYLRIGGLNTTNRVRVQFSLQNYEGSAVEVETTIEGDFVVAKVPQFILENPDVTGAFYNAYVFICKSESASCCKTTRKVKLVIRTRPKPEDYVFTDDEIKTFDQLAEDLRKHIDEDIEAALKDIEIEGVVVDDELSEESDNPVQNKVITAEVKVLREENEALEQKNAELESSIEKLQIKSTTDTQPFHHITDSANYRVLDFGMEGKTEQDTTSGKNLYSGGDIEFTGQFKTVTLTLAAGTYTFSALVNSTDTDADTCYVFGKQMDRGVDKRTYISFTTGGTVDGRFTIYSSNKSANGEGDTATFKDIQIEAGEVATDYEPYTNGPSPNPDYPQEIVNAGAYNEETGRYEYKCCVGNKNLFDESKLSNGEFVEFNGVRCFKCKDSRAGKFEYHDIFKENTQYTIAMRFFRESGNTNHTNVEVFYTDGTYQSLTLNPDAIKTITSSANKTIDSIQGISGYGDVMYLDLSIIQIELGSEATDYTPHASQQITLTSDRPLTKWDKLVKRDGVWGWSIWSKLYENVTESNISITTYGVGYRVYINAITSYQYAECMCNIARYLKDFSTKNYCGFWFNNKFCMGGTSELFGFSDDDDSNTKIQKFKDNILSRGITVVCQTKEEQAFIPLPDEEQTLLNNLETYYGVTNVYNEQGCPMWLTYVNDTKLYVDKQISSAIASAQALILEN